MLEETITNVKSKIVHFVQTANEYFALRMDLVTTPKPDPFSSQGMRDPEQFYKYLDQYFKLREKEKRVSDCEEKLNSEFNEALSELCKGMIDENLANQPNVIIIGLQDVLGKLSKIAQIDVFKGKLYATDSNKPILYEVSRKLSGHIGYPQFELMRLQIETLSRLEKTN